MAYSYNKLWKLMIDKTSIKYYDKIAKGTKVDHLYLHNRINMMAKV